MSRESYTWMMAKAWLSHQHLLPLGYSIGNWNHYALIIETTHVAWPYFDVSGTPLSDQVEFLERLTMNADQSRLNYRLTTIDGVTFRGSVVSERY